MKEGQSYPIGTIVDWYFRQRDNIVELIEFIGTETRTYSSGTRAGEKVEIEYYMVYDIKVDRSGVKGKPYKFGLPKGMVEGENVTDNKAKYLTFPKEGQPLISAKAIADAKAKESVEAKEIEWDGIKPTFLMTKEEYKAEVTPILKEFRKFIKKNDKYLIRNAYLGIDHLTYSQYTEKEIEKGYWYRKDITVKEKKEVIKENWLKKGKSTDKMPDEEYAKYEEFIERLTPYYGAENISKIESDELNSPKRSIRRAIDADQYQPLLLDGTITYGNLTEILSDAKLKVPKKLEKVATQVVVEKKTDKTIALSRQVEQDFHKKLAKSIRPEMQPFYDRYVNHFESSLEKFEEWRKTNDYGKDWKDRFCKAIGNACKMVQDTYRNGSLRYNHKGEAIMVKICCFESDRVVNSQFLDSDGNIPSDWKVKLGEKAEKHVQDLIEILAKHLLFYIKQNEQVLQAPDLVLANIYGATEGKIEGEVVLKYANGFTVTYRLNVIIAGGYNIQRAHYRYLTKPVVDGKTVSRERLQKLYSEFKPVKKKKLDKNAITKKIKAFKLMLDGEEDEKQIKIYNKKIKAFQIMLED